MKKIFMAVVMLSMVSIAAMASSFKVVEGDKKFFKTAEGNALLEFVWDGATYDGKKPLTDHFRDLSSLEKIGWQWFRDKFNDRCKKVQVVEGTNDVKYKFTIKVTKMDQYYKVFGFVPGNATKAWGTLTITDAASGATLLVVEFKEIDGGANPSYDATFGDCFKAIAKQLSNIK